MIRTVTVVLFALCLRSAASSQTNFTCRDDNRYVLLKICAISGLKYDILQEITDVNFPNATKMELLNSHFDEFGVEMFQLLEETEELTLRNGFVRTILFWSYTLSTLRVINTDLHMFDLVGQPNYSLKTLVIRSRTFNYWSPNMGFLKGLEVLDLAYCNFTYLNLDWMSTFRRLRVLELSNNRIQSLHSGPHLTMSSLEELFLSNNQLEYLWRFPDAFPKVSIISLASNKWLCDWVTIARNAIWVLDITLMDSDFSCPKEWEKNGGVCCKQTKNWTPKDKTNFEGKIATTTERVIEYRDTIPTTADIDINSIAKAECVIERNENGDVETKIVMKLQENADNTQEVSRAESQQITVILDKPLPFK